jgi:transposase
VEIEATSVKDGTPLVDPTTTIAALQRENARLAAERDEYKKRAEFLKRELDRLLDKLKTPREHVDRAQIQLAFDALSKELLGLRPPPDPSASAADSAEEGKEEKGKKKARKHTPHGRAVLPEHLPVVTLVITPTPLPENATKIREEVSFRLGFRRAGFYRLKVVRPVYSVSANAAAACDGTKAELVEGEVASTPTPATNPSDAAEHVDVTSHDAPTPTTGAPDERTVICAPAPHEMIERGLPSADLLAHVVTGKFADKLPYHRQEGMLARSGVHITRGVMCSWTERCHGLAKLVVKAMSEDALANAHFIATDATGVLVQANEKCKNGHFWVLVADQDHVIFRYSKAHTSDEPKRFLAGFRGVVVADASNVYDQLFAQEGGPVEQGCWSHARRYFYKALGSDKSRSLVALGFCNKLFEIERAIAKLAPDKRLAIRKEQSAPVVEALRRWRDEQLDSGEVHDGTPIRRALNYGRNHWDALTHFLQDGKIPIHNNRSELELRRLVVGRANWLFVGSDESAEWTCTFVSLVASCQLHGLDPEGYLRDLFRLLPVWPQTRFLELSPKHWRTTRARLDDGELALPLGPITVPPRAAEAAQEAHADQVEVAHGR